MRFTTIDIENYGPHRDLHLGDPLSPGLNVFVGPNSRGKSALRAFIRMILFNRIDRRQREAETFNYTHENGGSGAGAIRLEDANVAAYTIHRVEGAPAEVTGNATGGDELLNDLIGRIDPSLYKNVFSISLTELYSMASLTEAQVGERIYSAGLGLAVNLPDAIKRLEDERSTSSGLWAPRSGRLRTNLRDLNDLQSDLEVAAAELARYESIGAEVDAIESEIATLDTRISDARQREATLDDLTRLKSERRRARAEIDTGDATAAGRQAELKALPVSQALEEHSESVRRLTEELRQYAKAVEDRPALQLHLDEAESSIQTRIAQIGSGWDEQRIQSFDQLQAARDQLESAWSNVESTGQAESKVSTEYEVTDRAVSGAATTVDELNHRIEQLSDVPRGTTEQLTRDRERLERLRSAISERDNLRLRLTSTGQSPTSTARRSPLLIAALAIAGVAELASAAYFGQFLAAAAGGITIAIGLGLFWLGRSGAASSISDSALAEALAKAEGDVSSLAEQLGYDDHLADSAIVEAQNNLNRHVDQRRTFEQLSADASAANKTLESARADREKATTARHVASASHAKARTAWKDTLSTFDLPEAADLATAVSTLGHIETLKSDTREVSDLRHRISQIDHAIEDVESRLQPVLEAAEMPGFRPREATTALQSLQRAFEEHRTAAAHATGIEKQLAEWKQQRSNLEATVQRLDDEIESITAALDLLPSTTSKDPAYGIEQLQPELLGAARPATSRDPSVTLDVAIVAAKHSITEEITRLESDRDAARDRRTELLRQRTDLEEANPVADLQAQIDDLEQRIAADAHRWAVLTIARKAIEDTRLKYQDERQAPLHQLASKHLREITGGQCDRVEAVIGEEQIRVVESTGRTKSVTELSRGTREQLYLSLRFALIDEYAGHAETLPVVMDDVMVNFDADRTRAACATALEFSRSHQVLYLTCDERVAETFLTESVSRDCPEPALIRL